MADLLHTNVRHETLGGVRTVEFETTEGDVVIDDMGGEINIEIAFESATVAEAREILADVEDHEDFPAEAAEMARELLAEADEGSIDTQGDAGEEPTDSDAEDDTGRVVYVTDDGTEIRVGDRINHPAGQWYEIVGKTDDGILRKVDNSDDWGVTPSTAAEDIRKHGFAKRGGENNA